MFLYLRDGDRYYVHISGQAPRVFPDPLALAEWIESVQPDSYLTPRHAERVRGWACLPASIPTSAAAPQIQGEPSGSKYIRVSDLPTQEMRDSLMMFCSGCAMPILDDGEIGCFLRDYAEWAYAYAEGLRDVQRMLHHPARNHLFNSLISGGPMKFTDGLDADLRAGLLDQLRILWTYGSNAIEGNTFSLGDTQFLLEQGLTISGKTLREHNEIVGHAKAVDRLYQLIQAPAVSEGDVMALHRAILSGDEDAGMWKQQPNGTTLTRPDGTLLHHIYPSPIKVPELMAAWMREFRVYMTRAESSSTSELVEAHADLHLSLARIHPFQDGNGRMARLLANLPMLKGGMPPVLYTPEVRREYINLLQAYTLAHGRPSAGQAPLNPRDRHFEEWVALCSSRFDEVLGIVSEFRRLQAERQAESELDHCHDR